jgi:hypothetical protein
MPPVPRLDLAPRRKRSLSLRNPWDYLVLSQVRHLPHGTELYGIAKAMVTAQQATDVSKLAGWIQALEWPLIKEIAAAWQPLVIEAGGVAGDTVLRTAVPNPFEGYSGLPVIGTAFIGRRDTLRRIETHWAGGKLLPTLILYGHRRMGKTSILRSLEQAAPADTLIVYLDMQDAGWVGHTGELLLDLAEAIQRRAAEAGLQCGDPPAADEYRDLGHARRALNTLLNRLEPQMTDRRLILAVDEFELIEQGMEQGRIDPGLFGYLRALSQRHRWLALIFGGLHTLEEMGRDYRAAFYGQTEHIRVGYLSREDAVELITRPHPDFALEFAPELREELYRLGFGQPYLLQRLCWELVNHWKERFLQQAESTPRTLDLEDLDEVVTDDFYASTAYYFDGVWSNVTEPERALLKTMAQRDGPWSRDELEASAAADGLDAALQLLRLHDVIVEEDGYIRFASELMRRWVGSAAWI